MQNFFKTNLEYLKRIRNETYGSIALQVGCSANTVSYWVNKDFEPKMSELEKLSQYFEISIHQLLYSDFEKDGIPNNEEKAAPKREPPPVHSPPEVDYKEKYIALLEKLANEQANEIAALRADVDDIKKQRSGGETKSSVA